MNGVRMRAGVPFSMFEVDKESTMRSYAHLTWKQRYQIEQWLEAGETVSFIASELKIHRSTVYREKWRGRNRGGEYEARLAYLRALRCAQRSARNCRTKPATLWRTVCAHLRRDWSPEQISGRLKRLGRPSVSATAIYTFIRRSRGRNLKAHLRHIPRRKHVDGHKRGGGLPADRPSIHTRPGSVQLRRSLGHWEGDSMFAKPRNHRLSTLVERASRYVLIGHPTPAWAPVYAKVIVKALRPLPCRSITFDNGSEFAAYESIASSLKCGIYFADPGNPGQRGTGENTNGLIRQYIQRSTNLQAVSARQLRRIESKLNHRPRKCLGYLTPHEVLFNKTPVALRR